MKPGSKYFRVGSDKPGSKTKLDFGSETKSEFGSKTKSELGLRPNLSWVREQINFNFNLIISRHSFTKVCMHIPKKRKNIYHTLHISFIIKFYIQNKYNTVKKYTVIPG